MLALPGAGGASRRGALGARLRTGREGDLLSARGESAHREQRAPLGGESCGFPFRVVYQPIVDVWKGRAFAYEALARPGAARYASPYEMYDAAAREGKVGELGRAFRTAAVRHSAGHPLFMNVFPHEFDYGFLVQPDDAIFRHRKPIYLEVTESVPLEYFEQCNHVLAEVRKKGALLAIDDLGAGYSNLKYISDLAPEVVKLDRKLIAGVGASGRPFRLLESLVDLCHSMGAKVVAEGLETADELAAVRDAGVEYAQGYLLARPGFPPPPPALPRSG